MVNVPYNRLDAWKKLPYFDTSKLTNWRFFSNPNNYEYARLSVILTASYNSRNPKIAGKAFVIACGPSKKAECTDRLYEREVLWIDADDKILLKKGFGKNVKTYGKWNGYPKEAVRFIK